MVSVKSSYAMPLSTHGATGTGGGKEKYPLIMVQALSGQEKEGELMNKIKIYLDTSVISYLDQKDAPEQIKETQEVWEL